MRVMFIDTNGQRGIIWPGYSLAYDGEFTDEVYTAVATIVETAGDTPNSPPDDDFQKLVVTLPKEAPILETQLQRQ